MMTSALPAPQVPNSMNQKHNRRRSLHDASQFLQKLFRTKSQVKTGERSSAQWLSSLGLEGPGFDRRVVPQLIDRIAAKRPHAVWASIPKTADPQDGFRDITYRDFAQAIDRAIVWLEKELGRGKTGENIAYLSGSQLSSMAVTVAASKLDCRILFLSPRNSLEGQLSLIEALGCHFLATPKVQLPQTGAILTERKDLRHLIMPDLDELLEGPVPISRPFLGSFEDVRHKPFYYVHTSGTTSLPKPVPWTHGANASILHELTCAYPEGQTILQNMVAMSTKLYSAFPLFHAGGIIFPLIEAPMCGTECVLPPLGVPLTAKLSNQMYTSSKAPFAVLEPPVITEEVVKEPDYFENLLKQPIVLTGAAQLPKLIGDRIIQHGVPVRNIVASSETALPPLVVPDPESEWNSFFFAKGQGAELERMDDGRYELVWHRLAHGGRSQAVFDNFPDLSVYRTNDMFSRHPDPDKSHLWVIAGRSDDVIVLSNGEKFTPTALEDELQAHVDVKGVLVFGMQREQASLLIEPSDPTVSTSALASHEFISKLWPAVEQANSKLAAHGRIMHTHILLAKPDKPMLRTPKGSIQRHKMYDLYSSELADLYTRESIDATSDATAVQGEVPDVAFSDLKRRICRLIGSQESDLGNDTDIFTVGFDSLLAMQLTRELQQSMGRTNFEQVLIYNNPTVRQLASAISGRSALRQNSIANVEYTTPEYNTKNIASLLSDVSNSLPSAAAPSISKVVLLTGSSGGLGQHLLEQLRSENTHVFCLLRQPPSATQHPSLPNVTYLEANLSAPSLGLSSAQHAILIRDATHIIHNAWLVDFNQPLSFFAKNIDSVRGLILFAAAARHHPRIFFISSVSAVAGLSPDTTSTDGRPTVSETVHPLNDSSDIVGSSVTQAMGYAQSKRVAELLLAKASTQSGVPVSICRIGQIAGTSVSGMETREGRPLPSWQKRDWLPRLLASAKILGALPTDLGGINDVEWTPVDHVATTILELLEAGDAADAGKCQVFHLTNSANGRTKWQDMLPLIRRVLGNGNADMIELVRPENWIQKLEAITSVDKHDKNAASGNAGAQLVSFYKVFLLNEAEIPRLDTSRTVQASPALRSQPVMCEAWMEQWLNEWFGAANKV